MKLRDFINDYVFHNTMVRIWKPEDLMDPQSSKVLLTKNPIMEWEAKEVPYLGNVEVIGVTDIFCEVYREAVNIVVNTTLEPDDVSKLVDEWWKKRKREKGECCDGF